MSTKVGLGVVIRNDADEVLLMKRGSEARGHEQGRWENCGGEVEDGENPIDAAVREVREELGVEVSIERELLHLKNEGEIDGVSWEAYIFEGKIISGEPRIMEEGKCSEIGWFAIEQLKDMDLVSYVRKDFEKMGWV